MGSSLSSSYHLPRMISSFTPSCCVRPPPLKSQTPRILDNSNTDTMICPVRSHRRCPSYDEPSSPRVSCMGQIKGWKPSLTSSASFPTRQRLVKFTRMLSRRCMTMSPRFFSRVQDGRIVPRVNVADMDPPLPVVRRERVGHVSLWRRRRGGRALEGLLLQQQDSEGWKVIRSPR